MKKELPLYTFEYKEKEKEIDIDVDSLDFVWLVPGVEKAETIYEKKEIGAYGKEITVLRFYNGKLVTDIAIRFYAGITVTNDEISVHLCAEDEEEYVGRTIQFDRVNNSFQAGPIYTMPY